MRGDFIVEINDSSFTPVSGKMEGGKVDMSLDNNLKPGTYRITLKYRGGQADYGECIDPEFVSATFTVKDPREPVELRFAQSENFVKLNGKPEFDIYSSGTIKAQCILCKDSKVITSYEVNLHPGYTHVTMHESMVKAGNYSVIVKFDGDDKYLPFECSSSLLVKG